MNLGKIFDTDKAKEEAIAHFSSLVNDPDWIFLRDKLIAADVEEITNKILDPNFVWKEGEEREQKKIRAYWIILSQLPEKLVEALKNDKSDIFVDADPYYSNIEQIKDDQKKNKT